MRKVEIVNRLHHEEPDRTDRAYWQLLGRVLSDKEQIKKKYFTEEEYQEIKRAIQERKTLLPPKQFRKITAFGETKSPADWTLDSRCNVSRHIIYVRVFQLGWDGERAITTGTTNYKKTDKEFVLETRKRFVEERTNRRVQSGIEWVERFKQAQGSLSEMEKMAA